MLKDIKSYTAVTLNLISIDEMERFTGDKEAGILVNGRKPTCDGRGFFLIFPSPQEDNLQKSLEGKAKHLKIPVETGKIRAWDPPRK